MHTVHAHCKIYINFQFYFISHYREYHNFEALCRSVANLEECQRQQNMLLRQIMGILCGTKRLPHLPINLPLTNESDASELEEFLRNTKNFSMLVKFIVFCA